MEPALSRSNVPTNRKLRETEPPQTFAKPLEVLLKAVFDHLRAVPDLAQVGVDAPDHVLRPMPQLAGDGVEADRGSAIEGLQPRRAVGMAEGFGAELPGGEARPGCHSVQQLVNVS